MYLTLTLTVSLTYAGSPKKPKTGIPLGDYSYLQQKIGQMIKKQIKYEDVAGMSIAVIDGQETIWETGFGYADKENKLPATAETVYEVGSISKVFTATAVMQLVEVGAVELDQPLSTYLPSFKTNPPPLYRENWHLDHITLRHILTHHSGILGDFSDFTMSTESKSFQDITAMLHDEHATRPANKIYAYSNNGFAVLGHMIEAVSKMSFVDYMNQNIFPSANMTSSSFSHDDDGLRNISKGYREGKEQKHSYVNTLPGGALRSNIRDLATFAKILLAGDRGLISEQTIKDMWTRQNADIGLDLDIKTGLAWFLGEIPGVSSTVSHGGGTQYFRSQLTISPDHQLAVVALSNSTEANTGDVADQALKLAIETKTGLNVEKEIELALSKSISLVENIPNIEGHYQTDRGGHLYIKAKDDRFRISDMPVELRLNNSGGFSFYNRFLKLFWYQPTHSHDLSMSFESIDGEDVIVMHENGRRYLGGSRVEPAAIPGTWHSRLGEYRPVKKDADYLVWLEIDHGMLRLAFEMKNNRFQKKYAYAMEAINDEKAVILGLGYDRNLGKVIRAIDEPDKHIINFAGLQLRRDIVSP